MKPLDKKDMPKLYALVGIAVCVLGYAIVSLTAATAPPVATVAAAGEAGKPGTADGKGTVAPSTVSASTAPISPAVAGAPPAASVTGIASSATGAAGVVPGAPVPSPAMDIALMGPPTGGKDPFVPSGPASVKTDGRTVAVVPPVRPIPQITRPNTNLTALLGLDQIKTKRPTIDELNGTAGAVSPAPVAPPPVPAITVTGVVMGEVSDGQLRNVAILRGKGAKGEEERRFVSVGDYIGNGFSVAAVHPDGVDIRDKAGSRNVTLKIGQQQQGDNARAN